MLLGLSSALTFSFLGASPASASSATWTLEAQGQELCVRYAAAWWAAPAPVAGSWSSEIKVGIRDLPFEESKMLAGSTIAPGVNKPDADGNIARNGMVFFTLPYEIQSGEYTAEIYATDGTRTDTDTLRIVFGEENCR
ncbi:MULTISPECIES: DUF5980 family protein [unclassified Streptomyces]|uniref:DUF5980 family protein n=1 Tax=unclassified Streptomyces TaxID=2593676 RepID=UPI001F0C3B99|nr:MULTISPECIES: DUF5980 family protein [unclassified Streptomyces]